MDILKLSYNFKVELRTIIKFCEVLNVADIFLFGEVCIYFVLQVEKFNFKGRGIHLAQERINPDDSTSGLKFDVLNLKTKTGIL